MSLWVDIKTRYARNLLDQQELDATVPFVG